MRLLVLSNVPGSVDKIVDVLQSNHNIIAKESSSTVATLARTAAQKLQDGTYDSVIVVARDPISAGMLFNKQEGVNAAVCGSLDDVKLAKENGANVIVIRDINSGELHEIVMQAASGGGMMKGMKIPQIKMPELKVPQVMHKETEAEPDAKRQKPVAKKAKQEGQAEEEEEAPPPAEGGIVDQVKSFLGLR